ncbi:MAG: adenosylcobinamide-GDP ribazoletransferase [Acidimicrobiales bacterium]
MRARSAREAIAFLTPLGLTTVPSPRALRWFPAVGAGIGLAEGIIWRGARRRWPALPAAVVAVVADIALTGGLHLDGVADTADGLFAHAPAKGRLDIMAEPATGAFGTIAIATAVVARTAALAEMDASPLLLAAALGGSRSVMVLAMRLMPYARKDGLASAFLAGEHGEAGSIVAGAVGAVAAAALAGIARGWCGLLGAGAGYAAAAAVLGCARRRLGGFTGDVLGAAGVAAETVGLLWAARR